MEWEAAALVLSAAPYGESSAIIHLLTAEHGRVHGLVRGGSARASVSVWQTGNLVQVHWRARLTGQLGSLGGELVHASAARLLTEPLALAMLASACALADGALAEYDPHPDLFIELVRLISRLSLDPAWVSSGGMAALLRWEAALLGAIGFGLDLSSCAVTGATANLAFVSPRTGRAVSEEGAGEWRDRLMRLPRLLVDAADVGTPQDWVHAMRLTGRFLERDAFGQRHLPLPMARQRLFDRVVDNIAGTAPQTP